jgi:hypothetical protein
MKEVFPVFKDLFDRKQLADCGRALMNVNDIPFFWGFYWTRPLPPGLEYRFTCTSNGTCKVMVGDLTSSSHYRGMMTNIQRRTFAYYAVLMSRSPGSLSISNHYSFLFLPIISTTPFQWFIQPSVVWNLASIISFSAK